MPLIRRKIQPTSLSRRPNGWKEEVTQEYDLNAVTNVTLCNAVHQLASIILAAESVYSELQKQLDGIALSAQTLSGRLVSLETAVYAHNPKTVPVPEADLRGFSLRKENFCSKKNVDSAHFTATTQPEDVTERYNECSAAPRSQISDDQAEGHVVCEPVLGDSLKREKLRKLNLDIETRRPASFVALRDWCSDDDTLVSEFDLLPVSPATPLHHPPNPHPSGQKLPLPEQRLEALSHKYPPELVPIDVSGSGFKRMQSFRQSLIKFEYAKTKKRKRLKRRNTIANTRDVQSSTLPSTSSGPERSSSSRFGFSLTDRSFDTSSTKTSCERELPQHLLGFHVSVPNPPTSDIYLDKFWTGNVREVIVDAEIHHSSPRTERKGIQAVRKLDMAGCHDDVDCHGETGCQGDEDCHDSSGSQPTTNHETPMRPSVKLREGSSREEGTRSSSGNWSGSSSTRTSIESDAQQHIPVVDPQTVESQSDQNYSPDPSTSQDSFISDSLGGLSSSVVLSSDGTLTPSEDIPFADDDTSSAFSCDAEGYYTSFHTDSGLFHSDAGPKIAYDLKLASDRGDSDCDVCRTSTGTTNSSASLKTVVMRNPEKKVPPRPPQRVSSLEKEKRESIITVIHLNGSASSREDLPGSSRSISSQNSGDSSLSASSQDSEISKTDSGRETSSSARELVPPISRTEAEGRKDDFRAKTTINTIPSMCAITPPLSDEEKSGGQMVLQVEKPLAAVETKLYQKSLQKSTSAMRSAGVRQPGDGAVAPPNSTTVVTRNKDKGKPNLIVMSQKRASTGDLTTNLKERLPEAASKPKPYVEPYTLDKTVGERRAEIQSIFKECKIGGADSQRNIRGQNQQLKDRQPDARMQDHQNEAYMQTHQIEARAQPHKAEARAQPHQAEARTHHQAEGRSHSQQSEARQQPQKIEALPQSHSTKESSKLDARSALSTARTDASLTGGIRLEKQTHGNVVDMRSHPNHKDLSNLVAYKQLPAMSQNVPFSAVPSILKKNNTSHPTNSLDRKSTSKISSHVSLDADGRVVYSSDSLPRRKGHASFEPGPYVKPPPISGSDNTAPLKSKLTAYSSIQNMPLPPVPSETTVTVSKPNTAQLPAHKQNSQSQVVTTAQSYNPKATNQQHITTVSHTLSGLSSQLQPRTVSEINALRNSKCKPSKSDNEDTSKSAHFSDSEETSVQQRIQQQLKIRMDARNEASSPGLSSANYQYKKNEERCHTLPNPKHGQEHTISYQSLSYQQQLIKQAYQQQQQLQQLQEEQQLRKQQKNVPSQSLVNTVKDGSGQKQSVASVLAKIPESAYLTRQDIQHSIYQSQNEILRHQPSTTSSSRLKNESQPMSVTQPPSMGPLGPSPVYQTQMDPSLALAQQQMQAAQAASLGEHAVMHTRHNASYNVGPTSRAPTPLQGTSSPHRLPTSSSSLQYPLRSQTGTSSSSELNPSTDRVLIALANARLATASIRNFRATKLDNKAATNLGNEPVEPACPANPGINNQPKATINPTKSSKFVRNNSYKLATSPLSLPGLTVSPENPANLGNNFPRNKLNNISTVKSSRSLFHPTRRKFYGAQIKINPTLLPQKIKENSLSIGQKSFAPINEGQRTNSGQNSVKEGPINGLPPNSLNVNQNGNENRGFQITPNNLRIKAITNNVYIKPLEYEKPRVVGAIIKKTRNTEIW